MCPKSSNASIEVYKWPIDLDYILFGRYYIVVVVAKRI